MFRKVSCLLAVLALASFSEARPFRNRTAVAVAVAVPTTAQSAAVLISSTGRFRHNGGHGLFEGIGMARTVEAAIANCCKPRFGGGPREVGVARMANGLFVAVCRW